MTDDDTIRTLVARLARPHHAGGDVIERAAILAAGTQSTAILAWIAAHDGEPEAVVSPGRPRGGLHSARRSEGDHSPKPSRYVLPSGLLR